MKADLTLNKTGVQPVSRPRPVEHVPLLRGLGIGAKAKQ